jgi:hypothetical protein
MATTTPNYGWTVPTSSDLVKDGATAIETLGDAIDASMNTALGTKKAGMVLLNTTSFSGVASQSVNDVFSATYNSYKIIPNITTTDGISIGMRMRVSGSDLTSGYKGSGFYLSYTASDFAKEANVTTYFQVIYVGGSPNFGQAEITLHNPFATARTNFVSPYSRSDNLLGMWGGNTDATTSYTGFTLFPITGNMTGQVQVYGFNK